MRSSSTSWLLAGPLLALTAACASGTGSGQTEPAEAPDAAAGDHAEPALRVVAKLAPIADLVEAVGGERVEVDVLVPAGADSHTYEPSPSAVASLSDAEAFIGVGLDLNSGVVALAEENLPADDVVLLAERELDEDQLVQDHVHGDDGHSHSHGDDDHSHDEDGHAHGDEPGPNPHVWTSPRLTAALVDGVADTLTGLDPEGAEAYEQAATALRAELSELDAEIEAAVATIPEDDRTLVTYHDAWSYFARDYGLEMVTAVQPSDFSEPSAGDVRDIVDLVRDHDVPAIFGSEVFPSDVLEVIADETGATYVGNLADDDLPGGPGDPEHSYLGLMRRNATLVVEGLGGDASELG